MSNDDLFLKYIGLAQLAQWDTEVENQLVHHISAYWFQLACQYDKYHAS